MKNRLVVAALAAVVTMTSVEAGLSKAQTTAIGKAFSSLPRAEYAAKASELVTKAADADKQETAIAALKAAMAKAPAAAPAVVAAIAQIAPETAPAIAAAATKLSPNQADLIAKAAATAAPKQAAKIIMAVSEAAPNACGAVLLAVMKVVPESVKTGDVTPAERARAAQALAGGVGSIQTIRAALTAIILQQTASGDFVSVVDATLAAQIAAIRFTNPTPVEAIPIPGADIIHRIEIGPYGTPSP